MKFISEISIINKQFLNILKILNLKSLFSLGLLINIIPEDWLAGKKLAKVKNRRGTTTTITTRFCLRDPR